MSGAINELQADAISAQVKDKVVHDLGAGDLQLSIALLHLGARKVVAVDKLYERFRIVSALQKEGLEPVGEHFDRYAACDPDIDVAFVSWPVVYATQGLATLVARARLVIYLGTNFGGTSCGSIELWQHLTRRSVERVVDNHRNTLIIYGKHEPLARRRLLPEEFAALRRDIDEEPYQYGALEGRNLYFP